MVDAQFTFASMMHRGFFADQNAMTGVTIVVPGKDAITHQVPMMTPGDVIGIPSRQVIRTSPVNGLIDAEPNYLALIEFDAPDLPWLFSRTPASGPIQPWIALAVIDVTDMTTDPLSASAVGTQLTVDSSLLPNPAEAWMWAHGQLLDTDTVPDDPSRSLSRLVSSKELEAGRSYLACVVPLFEAGKTAGLGTDPGDARTSMDFAWGASGDVTLPVYCFWHFGTGPNGDFESLVRRLHGVPLPAGMGSRTLLLDYPMSGMPSPDPTGRQLELQVALRRPGSQLDDIEPLVGASYLETLRARLVDAGYDVSLLDITPESPPPVVGPPIYGQLAAGPAVSDATLATTAPKWIQEANLDPRMRVAAGLGGEVVRENQDRYVEEAWRQVGAVLAANALRRRGEFSLAASSSLHRKWISQVPAAELVPATALVHPRIFLGQDLTITGRLRQSPLPPSIVSVEYRRVTRARGVLPGAVAWRAAVGPTVLAAESAAVSPLNVSVAMDTIDTLEAPSQVWGVAAAPGILQRLVPGLDQTGLTPTQAATELDSLSQLETVQFSTTAQVESHAAAVDPTHVLTAVGMLPAATVAGAAGGGVLKSPEPPHKIGGFTIPTVLEKPAEEAVTKVSHLLADIVKEQPGLITHGPTATTIDTGALGTITQRAPGSISISPTVFGQLVSGTYRQPALPLQKFEIPVQVMSPLKQQISSVAQIIVDRQILASDAASLPLTSLAGGFDALRATIVAALDPAVTTVRMVNHQISALTNSQSAVLDDIMAAPDLSEPTYQGLAAISNDWLLPGIDTLPPDTTTLVESNRTFIDAFLVGMNHELARELLWREYPTNQRGTYSRQFWPHRITGDPADQYDLQVLLSSAPPARTLEQLGTKPGDVASPLVLVVKGELVRRYPGMLVTAAKTMQSGTVRALNPATEVQPDFLARLKPDVLLVGFDGISADDVWAAGGNEDTAWWFFFAEHFTEPRFGLDVATPDDPTTLADWNDASWGNAVVDSAGRLGAGSFAGPALPKSKPGTPPGPKYDWKGPSSSVAWILLQYPFRRGMRGTDLLPPKPVTP